MSDWRLDIAIDAVVDPDDFMTGKEDYRWTVRLCKNNLGPYASISGVVSTLDRAKHDAGYWAARAAMAQAEGTEGIEAFARDGREYMRAQAAADQENARLRDERAAEADGMTPAERAMVQAGRDWARQHYKQAAEATKNGNLADGIAVPLSKRPGSKRCTEPDE